MTGRIRTAKAFLLLVTAALGASVSIACAQQAAPAASGPIDALTKSLKFRADPVEPKDFVRDSRPSEDRLNFISTGSQRPQPPGKTMTADQVKAKQAELEAILARHDKVSGRKPAAARATTGAAKPKTAAVAR
jgi:hypothetical protein